MKPSEIFERNREVIRDLVAQYPLANPRLFGSVLHGTDRDDSDIDILVDALPGASLFDLAGVQQKLTDTLGIPVQVVTAPELGRRYRDRVLAEALPGVTDERVLGYLDTIIDAAENGVAMVQGMTIDDFLADRRSQLAVVMTIVLIAEAFGRLEKREPGFFAEHPEIEWDKIRGLRNRGVHAYDELNFTLIWSVAASEFAPLAETMKHLLAKLEAPHRFDNGSEST